MKLFHLSDLHIGKTVNNFSMIDEQAYILGKILEDIKREKPEAVLISGDVYDRSNPSIEAVRLLGSFLTYLAENDLDVILISGNHDSSGRLSFCSELIKRSRVYIHSVFNGYQKPIVLSDEYGNINFYTVPFIRITDVNNAYDTDITDYTEAFGLVVKNMNLNRSERNVLLSHQFVAGASFSESEEASSVGGLDCISEIVYEPFDYVALGHIHRAQGFNNNRIRYCGTQLKYSVKEVNQNKSYTVITLGEKHGENLCDIDIRTVPLIPKHDMISIEGSFEDIISAKLNENGIISDDYAYITLTDKGYIDDAAIKLRKLYPRLMSVDYKMSEQNWNINMSDSGETTGQRSPFEMFSDFFTTVNNGEGMNDSQMDILNKAIKEVWGE